MLWQTIKSWTLLFVEHFIRAPHGSPCHVTLPLPWCAGRANRGTAGHTLVQLKVVQQSEEGSGGTRPQRDTGFMSGRRWEWQARLPVGKGHLFHDLHNVISKTSGHRTLASSRVRKGEGKSYVLCFCYIESSINDLRWPWSTGKKRTFCLFLCLLCCIVTAWLQPAARSQTLESD